MNDWDKILVDSNLNLVNNDLENVFENKYVKYDAASCLNLLDRCDMPFTTLRKIKNSLVKNGILIVALVLPFKPYVEYNNDNRPKENLFDIKLENTKPIVEQFSGLSNNTGFCETQSGGQCKKMNRVNTQIRYLIENVFDPIGFELVKFTRMPYLCEGNLAQSYFYMFDYVFLFRSK